jgi:hypothetical protein
MGDIIKMYLKKKEGRVRNGLIWFSLGPSEPSVSIIGAYFLDKLGATVSLSKKKSAAWS